MAPIESTSGPVDSDVHRNEQPSDATSRSDPGTGWRFSFQALDANGKIHGARHQAIALDLKPETRARVEQTGIRLLNRLELPPGQYQLRVAARDPAKRTVGAVTYVSRFPISPGSQSASAA